MTVLEDKARLDAVTAPDFTLEDIHGAPVTLSDYRGQKNVLLVMIRGLF